VTDLFLVTCEHGGNRIPSRYRALFDGYESLLSTHRAYDAGALRLARDLSSALRAPLCASTVSRLLIDLNRSITHPRVYSEATRAAPTAIREEIRRRYHTGYRSKAELQVSRLIATGHRAIHVSCHSFTPELNGKRRDADIGLLYDPMRSEELALCRRWRAAIKTQMPGLKIRMNYPYAGKSDGLTSFLRRRFAPELYLGIELEINQRHVFDTTDHWRGIRSAVASALREISAYGRDSS
jgi:predicted N-formylglutamate amidohydrolase